MSLKFTFSSQDFIFKTAWNKNERSRFDEELISKWTDLQRQESCFRYKFNIEKTKILPGIYFYVAQLNTDRANKRKPVNVQTMSTPFDPSNFNFTKINKENILFQIYNMDGGNPFQDNYIIVNESPFELGHSLLLPSLHEGLPQVVTKTSLRTALEVFLLSNTPAMRMGFNGLNAFASINHLHFHIFYLQHQMLLETISVEKLSNPCYVLTSFPSHGFVFQLAADQDVEIFASDVFKLIHFLQIKEKPHNIFITRGLSFEDSNGLERDHVRVYVWARKPSPLHNEILPFNPAFCEMFGHLIITDLQYYESLNEDIVTEKMTELTKEPFLSVVEEVKQLYDKR